MQRVPAKSLDYDDGQYYLDGNPFTGVAYIPEDNADWVQCEIEMKDGLENGVKREWWEPGKLMSEATWSDGALHGKKRSWHDDGRLAEEGEYEFGIPIWEREWDEDGELVSEYQLKEGDSNYAHLQKMRALDKEAEAKGKLRGPPN
jgi:antitoxin component YwqK of YwqJK toxin-antitoxin module